MTQPERRMAIVAGRPARYRVVGEGPPLVLIHGLSGSTRWWSRNLAALSARFEVYAIDLPGFGENRRWGRFRLDDVPARLLDWLDVAGIARASFVGHSMGGFITADLAARAPERVDRLVLVGPDGAVTELDSPFTEITQVVAVGDGRSAAVVAAGPVEEPAPYLVEVVDEGDIEPIIGLERLREPRDDGVDPSWFSRPTHLTFRSAGDRRAHALLYPPHHPEVQGPSHERPPLIVVIHGGPT